MSYILRPTIISGLLLLSMACGLADSPGDSRIELGENSVLEENTTPVTPNNDLVPETAIAEDSSVPSPTPKSSALDEDCTLTLDNASDLPPGPSAGGAPAAPNQTMLIAIGQCVWQVQASSLNIEPEMLMFIAEVEIVEANDVEGFMNRLTGQQGQTIKIFSKTPIPPDAAGQTIEALVTFRGDEHGGKYWVINDQLSIH